MEIKSTRLGFRVLTSRVVVLTVKVEKGRTPHVHSWSRNGIGGLDQNRGNGNKPERDNCGV